jgi:hypothetical protein
VIRRSHRPLIVSALAALAVGLVGAPSASAQGVPFKELSVFDRIAVTFTFDEQVFVVVRSTGVLGGNVVEDITPPPNGSRAPAPKLLAWAPGGGSFALTEISPLDSPSKGGDQLRIVEHPGGAVHNLSPKIEQLRGTETSVATLGVPRFGAPGSGGLRLMLGVTGVADGDGDGDAGVASFRPDGTDGRVLTQRAPFDENHSLFNTGVRAVRTLGTHTQNGKTYTDVVVQDLASGAQTAQLTNTPFVDERAPALSPDGSRVAYIEGGFDDAPEQARLFIVGINGTSGTAISPDTTIIYSHPAWRPDGQRIAFIGHRKRSSNNGHIGKPVVYSIKPDGTDMQRHTSLNGAGFPLQTSTNGLFPRHIAWGRTCSALLGCSAGVRLVDSNPLGGLEVQIRPQLDIGAPVGIVVERYAGRRLRLVGRVPFGKRRKGRPRVRWNGRVSGRRLRPGRYRITLRRLDRGIPVEVAQPVDLIVRARGAARVARPRRL